ncbi:hypothetical protein Bpfe_027822 [Biomphalaria pfeifferi]|uniref:Transmembrane protein 135 N-terminal domain-containing protein n=1 Tax=Biomphalaria pfeifferi TaxID=112525 RepID=A0AAD8AW42_BIOPF|nr:hypothetical protein Bpfe_027822 [Biomphalaria pfeifferi]
MSNSKPCTPRSSLGGNDHTPTTTWWKLVCTRLPPELRKKIVMSFMKRFARGFCGGIVLYSFFRIITALLKNPFRESLPKIVDGILSTDSVKVATFLGLYPSLYHLLVELLTAIRRNNDGWTYGAAGGIAGLSAAVLNKSNRQTLAFFTLARALGAIVSTLVTRGVLVAIPFFEVAIFSLCTSIILYCVALKPDFLNPGYYKSILKWSRDYTDENLSILFRMPAKHFLTCQDAGLHQGNCTQQRLNDLIKSLPGFAKLYLPIHMTPVIVFKRKVLFERPFFVFKSLVKNLVLSTSFLGLMVTLAKLTICLLRNYSHQPPPLAAHIPMLAGAICGLALLLEHDKRRKELCLFVIPHTINILYIAISRSSFRFLFKVPNGFTFLFALSMMSIMHSYEREPESLTLLVNGLLKIFVGPRKNIQKMGK